MKKLLLLSMLALFLGFGLIACGSEHELVGDWAWVASETRWFRFYEDGKAVNLNDDEGEEFTWHEDGSLNALVYESWSIDDDILTITWTNGLTFEYIRYD